MANQFCILKFNHTIVQRFEQLVDTGLYKGFYNYHYYYFSATAGAVSPKQIKPRCMLHCLPKEGCQRKTAVVVFKSEI